MALSPFQDGGGGGHAAETRHGWCLSGLGGACALSRLVALQHAKQELDFQGKPENAVGEEEG